MLQNRIENSIRFAPPTRLIICKRHQDITSMTEIRLALKFLHQGMTKQGFMVHLNPGMFAVDYHFEGPHCLKGTPAHFQRPPHHNAERCSLATPLFSDTEFVFGIGHHLQDFVEPLLNELQPRTHWIPDVSTFASGDRQIHPRQKSPAQDGTPAHLDGVGSGHLQHVLQGSPLVRQDFAKRG